VHRIEPDGGLIKIDAFITERGVDLRDRNGEFTRFRSDEITLREGANRFEISCTDRRGNATTMTSTIIFDPTRDEGPPEVEIDWPKTDTVVQAETVRIRGKVNRRSARILFRTEDGEKYPAEIGRNGAFWAYRIPLRRIGPNRVTMEVRDDRGATFSKDLIITRSSIIVTIDPISTGEKPWMPVSVSGTVSEFGYRVFVNGVEAEVEGKRWKADRVLSNNGIVKAVAVSQDRRDVPPAGSMLSGTSMENPRGE
jgi:hypothetical protein